MKNLFASASYAFDNFYNNLNTQGQMIFSIIIFLILVLCILLLITYIMQNIKNKRVLKKLNDKKEDSLEILDIDDSFVNTEQTSKKEEINDFDDISDIAKRVEDAIKEEKPINLTNFEEDQEKMAIISIDELMKRAKELEIIEDEEDSNVNYLEKYNLEPSEIKQAKAVINKDEKKEVKAFKVSQIISPVYGVKKEAYNSNNNNN